MEASSHSPNDHSPPSVEQQPPAAVFPRFGCRVNALDSEYSTEEHILSTLKKQLSSCWSPFFSNLLIPDLELTLLLRLIIYFAPIYRNRPTPADAMFNVKLENAKQPASPHSTRETKDVSSTTASFSASSSSPQPHQNLTVRQKWLYLVLMIVGPWLVRRLRVAAEQAHREYNARKLQHQMRRQRRSTLEPMRNRPDGDGQATTAVPIVTTNSPSAVESGSAPHHMPPYVVMEEMSPIAKLHLPLSHLAAFYEFLSLTNLLVFLTQGRYRSLEERLLGLQVAPIAPNADRQLDFASLNDDILWNTTTQGLMAVVPCLDLDAITGVGRRLLHWLMTQTRKAWREVSVEMKRRIMAISSQGQSNGGNIDDVCSTEGQSRRRRMWSLLQLQFIQFLVNSLIARPNYGNKRRFLIAKLLAFYDPTTLELPSPQRTGCMRRTAGEKTIASRTERRGANPSEGTSTVETIANNQSQHLCYLIRQDRVCRPTRRAVSLQQNNSTSGSTDNNNENVAMLSHNKNKTDNDKVEGVVETDDSYYGKGLALWCSSPSSTGCGLCGLNPVTLPAIGDCQCLSPFCYLCITMKICNGNSRSPFICPCCGVFITEAYQIGTTECLKYINSTQQRNNSSGQTN